MSLRELLKDLHTLLATACFLTCPSQLLGLRILILSDKDQYDLKVDVSRSNLGWHYEGCKFRHGLCNLLMEGLPAAKTPKDCWYL